jgi:hypothetical protein
MIRDGTGWHHGDRGWYFSISPGVFYQSEWKYFVFGISPSYSFQSIRIDYSVPSSDPTLGNWSTYEYKDYDETFAVDLQFLAKAPLVKKDYTISLLGGAGAALDLPIGIGFNALAGLDFGFRMTGHHFLFLNYTQCVPIINSSGGFMESHGQSAFLMNSNLQGGSKGFPFVMQLSLGIRTTVYQNIYYYKNTEVGRARRR